MPYVRASLIAQEFGFSSRHWIRLAAAGKIPCATQPSGPGGHWLFELDAFREWFATRAPRPVTDVSNHQKATREEISKWLNEAILKGRQ